MARISTKNHWTVGRRVEIPAYCDLWMRGARFGTVERFIEGEGSYLCANDPRAAPHLAVRMDHPQVSKRCYRFIIYDCRILP